MEQHVIIVFIPDGRDWRVLEEDGEQQVFPSLEAAEKFARGYTTHTPHGDNYRAIKLGNWQTAPFKEIDPFYLHKVYYRT